MKKSILTILTVATLALPSCMKEPMACVTPSKTTAAVSEMITFDSSCSMDVHHYEWNFGDGTMSMEASPMHAYTNVGTYTVTFMGMSKNEKKMDEVTQTIIIQ